MAARRQATSVPAETGRHILREAEALIGGAVAVFIALALLSYSAEMPAANLGGPLGHPLADTALRAGRGGAYLRPGARSAAWACCDVNRAAWAAGGSAARCCSCAASRRWRACSPEARRPPTAA